MTAQVYTVHLRRSATPTPTPMRDGDLVLVPECFNWWAFLFSVPWALMGRMWTTAVVIFAVQILISVIVQALSLNQLTASIVSLGLAVIVGLSAADLRAVSLKRKGFDSDGVVVAESLHAAERRYLDAHPELATEMAGAS